jgi:HEAT repeat protein
MLSDPEDEVRFAAADALTQIDPGSKTPLNILIDSLCKWSNDRRRAVAIAIRRLGPAAVDSLHAIIDILKTEENEEVRTELLITANYILSQVGSKPLSDCPIRGGFA